MPGRTTGTKRERDELRRRMLADRASYEQIANEMRGLWGFRLRTAWRHAHGWTQEEVAARFNQVTNDPNAAMTGNRISDFESWPCGGIRPTPENLIILGRVYEAQPSQLIDFVERQKYNNKELLALRPLPKTPPAPTTSAPDDLSLTKSALASPMLAIEHEAKQSNNAVRHLVVVAASQSISHAENVRVTGMSEATLEEITAEVERLTREHLYASPAKIFPDTVRARDQIYRLLEQRQYPRQTEQLYFLAAITCVLLADGSVNLGLRRAAEEQLRASFAYAEIIGHNSLRLVCRRLQAWIAFWGDRPRRAWDLMNTAQEWATEPLGRAAMLNSLAVFAARMGRFDDARTALADCQDSFSSATGGSELFERIGGMFSYPPAKMHQISTIACLNMGDAGAAASHAAASISEYESGPPELRAMNEIAARFDLGAARLMLNDIDGVEDALGPALAVPQSNRLDYIVLRLKDFYQHFRTHEVARSTQGAQLIAEIEDFTALTAHDEIP